MSTAANPDAPPWWHQLRPSRQHVAIALVSAAVILLQITVTRILSVLLWYHFAFFSISLAMLGLGVPGVWLSLARPKAGRLPSALLAAAALVPVGLGLMISVQHLFGPWGILLCMLCMLPAVLALGTAVCLLLLSAPGAAIGRMYAWDLLGACVGAFAVVGLMSLVPTPWLAAGVGLLPLGAYVILYPHRRPRLIALGLAALVAVALWLGQPLEVRHTKAYAEVGPRFTPIYEKWTPTARLTVFDGYPWAPVEQEGFRWGLGSKGHELPFAKQYWLEQDGSAGTPIVGLAGGELDPAALEYLLYDVTSVGYQLRRPKRVAIIGSGGGRDILTARLSGAKVIDAIELNGAIVDVVRGRFVDFSGGVYDLPDVHPIVGEGRSVMARSPGKYPFIQISMIDSWAATTAGAYALSENNLYTIEAYRLFLGKLAKTGMVSTSRWMPDDKHGFELPRLILLVAAALEAEGVTEPGRHLAVVQGGAVGTVLASRSPLTPAQVERLAKICVDRGFLLHWPSPNPGPNWVGLWLETGPDQGAKSGMRLTPPTDDKPFFFQMLSPFAPLSQQMGGRLGFNAQSVSVLLLLMIVMTVVTLVLFFLPFLTTRWLDRAPGFWRGSLYFVGIGLAFMLIELAWLGRFVLYLGHPSRATTAALACLLLGAGLGSMTSARLGLARAARWGWLVAVVVGGLNLALTPLFGATIGWPLPVRVLVAAFVLVPAGFVMGFLFPLGMVRFGELNRAWFWALNGAAGVLASVLSLALAMEIGFSQVAMLGAGLYILAWLLLMGKPAEQRS